jgi:hypothetical protein
MATLPIIRGRVRVFDAFVFRRPQWAVNHCCSAEWGDMAKESVPEHGYESGDANVYARGRHGTLIENAHAGCYSIVRALTLEGSWLSIVAPESGSVNGGGHAHDCGRWSWQMQAEHRMKPFYAQQPVRLSLEARARSSSPRMCIVTAVYSQSPFSPSCKLGCLMGKDTGARRSSSSYNVVAVVKMRIGNVSISWRWGKMGRGCMLISSPLKVACSRVSISPLIGCDSTRASRA